MTDELFRGATIDRIRDSDLDVTNELDALGAGTGNFGGNTIYRLRRGLGQTLRMESNATPNQTEDSEHPVMMDAPLPDSNAFGHIRAGANVLYMDGHVSLIHFDMNYPVTAKAVDVLKRYSF